MSTAADKPMEKHKSMKNLFRIAVVLYILADLAFVFYLQYHNVIDGDLVEIVLPTPLYQKVMQNPLGIDVVLHGAKYAGSNGFLGYWFINKYFHVVPAFFRLFTSPLNSLYMSCALATVLMKLLYTYVLAVMASGEYRPFSKKFLTAAVILVPVIQTGSYRWIMGIVDPMLISMFAYSRCNFLILLFFMPFFLAIFHGKAIKFGPVLYALLLLLGIYNGYNGPLASPLVCMVYAMMLGAMWLSNFRQNTGMPLVARAVRSVSQIPRPYFVIGFATLVSAVWCYLVGRGNAESFVQQLPLLARYGRLPRGLWNHFSSKGLWLLSLLIIVNLGMLLRRRHDAMAKKALSLLSWVLLFSVIYILMLPLGGYRFYRPNIIRRDIFSPVLVAMVGTYGITTYYLLRTISASYKKYYTGFLAMCLAHYALANTRDIPDNSCERAAIEHIVASKDKIVRLEEQCTIFNWFIVRDYRESAKITRIMNVWGILNEKEKYFYQDSVVNGVRVEDQKKVYF